ncbi:MAG: J domain-containing protein, partial [Planctomycetes bacterium]|nr:J domain-containing protein [Planctomycetota bacterium]
MSPDSLPEDPAEWPENRFTLFGLDHNATLRDLRKAYANLIRRFKPEHYPLQFRLIREAFEALQILLEQKGPSGPAPGPEENPGAGPQFGDWSHSERPVRKFRKAPPPVERHDTNPPSRLSRLPALDEAWENAVRQGSDWKRLYRQLVEAAKWKISDEILYCRLYWLLLAVPSVDPVRAPIEWLALGMERVAEAARLRALYVRELQRRPEDAIREPAARALAAAMSFAARLEVAEQRWSALYLLDRLDLIAADITRLRPLFLSHPADWVELLLRAVRWLCWSNEARAQTLRQSLQVEIDETSSQMPARQIDLEQHDLLLMLSEEFRTLTRDWETAFASYRYSAEAAYMMIEIIPDLWLETPRMAERLEHVLQIWEEDPVQTMYGFDAIYAYRSQLVWSPASRLEYLVATTGREVNVNRYNAINTIVGALAWKPYRENRRVLLAECLTFDISVEEL